MFKLLVILFAIKLYARVNIFRNNNNKTNFTDHHSPNTIHCVRDSVLVCKMHDCMIRKNFEHFHSSENFKSNLPIGRIGLIEILHIRTYFTDHVILWPVILHPLRINRDIF